MKLLTKDEIKVPTLKELKIDANGVSGDIMQTLGEGPITCGFFRLDSPGGFDYGYTFEEFKFVLEGEFTVTDSKGNKVIAKKGDILYFQNGDKVTFDTNSSGSAFYVSQRRKE